jgi:hypothetical protein
MENPDNEDIIIQIEETLQSTRGIKNIGGTNKPLTPCQSTVNASIPVEYIFQYLVWNCGLTKTNLLHQIVPTKMENPDNEDIIIQIEETLHLFLWPNNITTFFPFPVMFYLPCAFICWWCCNVKWNFNLSITNNAWPANKNQHFFSFFLKPLLHGKASIMILVS